MRILKRLVPAAAVLLSSGLAACSDSLSPDTVDPAALEARMDGVSQTFNNASFQSLAQTAFLFPQYAAVAALRATLPRVPRSGDATLLADTRARLEAARLYASLRANPQALFPANVLGKTLEYDPVTQQYVVGNLTGAPSNGIRIIIYTYDPIADAPNPNQQLGYVELTDESSAQADELGVLVTLGTSTVADYAITFVSNTNSLIAGAQGFIRNAIGTEQVNFDFEQALTATTLTSSAVLEGSNGGAIHLLFEATATNGTFTITVSHGENSLEMQVGVTDQSDDITGGLKFNGTTVGTISGTQSDPVFTGVNGRTLTVSQAAALIAIFGHAIYLVGEVSDAVFAPGSVVFN